AIQPVAFQGWIVGVTLRTGSIEGCWVRAVERCVSSKTSRQVRIGDEHLPKGHGIGFAFVKEPLPDRKVDGLVSNEHASEGLSKRRAKAVGADVLPGCD